MSKPVSLLWALFVAVAAAGTAAAPARAALIEQDLFGAGDNLITLDEATGFEWLDVEATLGLSFDAAKGTNFVTDLGFRHATQSEVKDLYVAAGVSDHSGVFRIAILANAQEFIAKLSCTGLCGTFGAFQSGWSDFGVDGFAARAEVELDLLARRARANCIGLSFGLKDCAFPADHTIATVGNYLLRNPNAIAVPEPATALLFGLGLAALAGFGHRRAA